MTDREMAVALGEYINRLLVESETLKGVVKRWTENPETARNTPLEEMRRQVAEDEMFQETVASHSRMLLHALASETEAPALIRALCRNYFLE